MSLTVHTVQAGDIDTAIKHGLTVLAVCGVRWVPTRKKVSGLPRCPECEAVQRRAPRAVLSANENRPHYVYRCYDEAGVLLYVGCTVDLATRRLSHSASSWWFPEAASFRVTVYPNRQHALQVEADAISTERPLWNVRHQEFFTWPKDQLRGCRDRARALDAPANVLRRFERLAASA